MQTALSGPGLWPFLARRRPLQFLRELEAFLDRNNPA